MQALCELTEYEYLDFEYKATIFNAKEWEETDEKYVYCLDYLELSAWDDNADRYVNKLEYHFEALLGLGIDLPVKKKRPTLRILIKPVHFQKRAIQ